MQDEKAFEVLRRVGDPIEKHIVQSVEHLSPVLYPYAGVWADHVLLRRRKGAPSFVEEEWMPFAGSHYTALIRCYHAWQKYGRILDCCATFATGDRSAGVLLDVHDAVAGFWEHIGSAIDNLALCFEDAPCIRIDREQGCKYLQKRYRFLNWAYDRRSQLIHSRLIPKGLDGGVLYFNVRLLDSKGTDWATKYERQEIAEDFYKDQWRQFLAEMADAWQHLRNWLRNKDKRRPTVQELETPSFDPVSDHAVLTGLWGDIEAPSTIRMTAPDDAINGEEVTAIQFPTIPPSGIP